MFTKRILYKTLETASLWLDVQLIFKNQELQMTSVRRINLYDNMKAIAIILVVIGHINEFSLGGYNSYIVSFL